MARGAALLLIDTDRPARRPMREDRPRERAGRPVGTRGRVPSGTTRRVRGPPAGRSCCPPGPRPRSNSPEPALTDRSKQAARPSARRPTGGPGLTSRPSRDRATSPLYAEHTEPATPSPRRARWMAQPPTHGVNQDEYLIVAWRGPTNQMGPRGFVSHSEPRHRPAVADQRICGQGPSLRSSTAGGC